MPKLLERTLEEVTSMPKLLERTLEEVSSIPTERQEFRITHITPGKDVYGLNYQLADGIEWLKAKEATINATILQTNSALDELKNAIRRVFKTETVWGDNDLDITSIGLTYTKEDDKGLPKLGIQPKAAGSLLKIAIGFSHQSAFILSMKGHWIKVEAFDQYVDADLVGNTGYLESKEVEALEILVSECSRELARQLNKKVEFKPAQLRLI